MAFTIIARGLKKNRKFWKSDESSIGWFSIAEYFACCCLLTFAWDSCVFYSKTHCLQCEMALDLNLGKKLFFREWWFWTTNILINLCQNDYYSRMVKLKLNAQHKVGMNYFKYENWVWSPQMRSDQFPYSFQSEKGEHWKWHLRLIHNLNDEDDLDLLTKCHHLHIADLLFADFLIWDIRVSLIG